ncbi:sugar ABC transporter permease [Sedimentitalea todarodis]|uniref:Xylose transport system permease protein XylH n=1 Tax=Sedimentitalea todarodis TaxID=1631240 RepID=A0ABU3VGT1_9RHOB|nr:ABC transporter permease [Sedimentitalea todarodis]MDU9005391.1 ABC transporter permease [Sedimentitalea todarodis]
MANATTTNTAPPSRRRGFGELLTTDLRALPIVLGLVALWIFFALQSDVFLTPRNLSNLLVQSTVVGVMALGLMFVLLIKEIDLSVAAINGVTSVLMAKFIVEFGFSPWIAVPIAVLIGAGIGSLSARWVTFVGVPSFVVTLGLGLALNGLQLILLPETARYSLNGTGLERIALTNISGVWAWIVLAAGIGATAGLVLSDVSSRGKAGLETPFMKSVALPIAAATAFGIIVVSILTAHQGIPLVVLIFAVLLGIGGYVLKETQFGLFLYAVGNNDEAARRSGVNVARIKMTAFAIAGGVAALAGVIAASRTLGVGVFSGGGVGGGTLLLESIAAAVIGGVSLFGGRGAIHAALLGALVIGTVSNGLNLMGVENEIRLIVTGLLLVLAVSIDKLIEKATGQQSF